MKSWWTQLFVLSCIVCVSRPQILRRKLSPSQQEGRVPELDALVEHHISSINKDKPENMKTIIAEAKSIASRSQDKEMADYYVRVLDNINTHGIDFINDERDRLHTILESTKGAEYDFAHYQNNVVEGMVDAAAHDVLNNLPHFNMDMWDDMKLDHGRDDHDEV